MTKPLPPPPRTERLDQLAKEIHELLDTGAAAWIIAGGKLEEARKACAYGEWGPWLHRHFKWTQHTALNYINMYARFGDKLETVSNLQGQVLRMLAAPGTQQKVVDRILMRKKAGEQVTIDSVKQEIEKAKPITATAEPAPTILLKTHLGDDVPYFAPKGKLTFNRTNEQVSWAAWTWNPVTGCLHGCRYCYARELANKPSYKDTYPIGFAPLFHHERLDAPRNTSVPEDVDSDPRLRRVFVCSMADLYGKWVPDDWIERVHASCRANPQWDYLMLTKFPRRYVGLDLPATAWIGTSIDEQKRVRLAEDAFRQIKGVHVKWLSLEPLLAPLEFSDLSMFDWIVIGSQSATEQPDGHVAEFAPPIKWVARLIDQAHECGCRVYCKPNLLGETGPQSPGMQMPQELPTRAYRQRAAADQPQQ